MASSKDRQRRLARAKQERRLVRRAEKLHRKRRIQAGVSAVVAVLVIVLGTVWLTGGFSSKKNNAADSNIAAGSCTWNLRSADETTGIRDTGHPPTSGEVRTGTRSMTIITNVGEIDADMDLSVAPCTAMSFGYLADKSFFDNTTCHRLNTTDLFLQCGDPADKGTGGPSYTFADESLPVASPGASTAGATYYAKGTLAMANPGANGSQFLIFYKDGSKLPPNYSIFGKVTKGLDVVEKVAQAGALDGEGKATDDGAPKTNVTITKLTVGPAPGATPSDSASPSASASTSAQ